MECGLKLRRYLAGGRAELHGEDAWDHLIDAKMWFKACGVMRCCPGHAAGWSPAARIGTWKRAGGGSPRVITDGDVGAVGEEGQEGPLREQGKCRTSGVVCRKDRGDERCR